MEGKIETEAFESKSDDSDLEDLEDMLLGEEVENMSLMDMYRETFQDSVPVEVILGSIEYNLDNLVGALSTIASSAKVFERDLVSEELYTKLGVKKGSDTLNEKEKKARRRQVRKNVVDFIKGIVNDRAMNRLQNVDQKIKSMMGKDYGSSGMSEDEYKRKLKDYLSYARDLVVSEFSDAPEIGVTVDMEKKARLKRILQVAIKIGLNYQMLSEFKPRFYPRQYDFDDDDSRTYFANTLLRGDLKKVKMSDVADSPYWEGIRVVPDMGEYVSVESLKAVDTDQLVNTVKRTTLYRVHKVSPDYHVNLDTASPSDFKTLCTLKTLELAPNVHADASRHFARGTGQMEAKYKAWLKSPKSFKPYRKEVEDDSKFIDVPYIPYAAETTVSEVLDDLSLLPGLIKYRNHDDHENEIVKNGDLFLVDAPSDAEFAMELSRAFVQLGFLPEGYERYCGVKVGEVRAKRSSDGTVSPAKRPREKLFTPVESY